jgi:hypothetical protein
VSGCCVSVHRPEPCTSPLPWLKCAPLSLQNSEGHVIGGDNQDEGSGSSSEVDEAGETTVCVITSDKANSTVSLLFNFLDDTCLHIFLIAFCYWFVWSVWNNRRRPRAARLYVRFTLLLCDWQLLVVCHFRWHCWLLVVASAPLR